MWNLIRKNDGLIRRAPKILWIEFNEDGTFLKEHDKPKIGYSLLLSPFNKFFTWQTTEITEILEEKDEYIHFKTKNSEYELSKQES